MPALALALALLVASPALAATIVLDFEEEALGSYQPSFVSAECGCVRFSESHEVTVIDYYLGTRALLVGEEGGSLVMEFFVPVTSLSLDFVAFFREEGVDYRDPRLIAYSGGEVVGEATMTPDPDGPHFQTISIQPGTVIDSARFIRVALGEYEPNSPIVDNLVLETVPEPGTLGLLALALGVPVGSRRERVRSFSRCSSQRSEVPLARPAERAAVRSPGSAGP